MMWCWYDVEWLTVCKLLFTWCWLMFVEWIVVYKVVECKMLFNSCLHVCLHYVVEC